MSSNTNVNPADSLVGKVLKGKWLVTKVMDKKPNGTGGTFSICYEVEDGQKKAFLKALNFSAFASMARGRSITEVLKEYIDSYEFEKSILIRCKDKSLNRVASIIDEGQESVPGSPLGQIPYLIFELADSDLRSRITDFSGTIDTAWKLRSLHNIAVGIQQLHSVKISHQDLKPSNVLVFDKEQASKIGDLGRSLCQDIRGPHDHGGQFTGDSTYAPPELFYGYYEQDWALRTRQVDLYMFGSLAMFYFTGLTLTTLIFTLINQTFHYTNWRGRYEDVKPYLVKAFYDSMDAVEHSFQNPPILKELFELIKVCSHPEPNERGMYRSNNDIPYNLPFEPIISKLDLLARRMEMIAAAQ